MGWWVVWESEVTILPAHPDFSHVSHNHPTSADTGDEKIGFDSWAATLRKINQLGSQIVHERNPAYLTCTFKMSPVNLQIIIFITGQEFYSLVQDFSKQQFRIMEWLSSSSSATTGKGVGFLPFSITGSGNLICPNLSNSCLQRFAPPKLKPTAHFTAGYNSRFKIIFKPTSKLLKCHGRICEKGFWVINHWPTQHANLVILMGRRAMATPAVASLSVNDAEAVAHFVSVADGSLWVTYFPVPKMKSTCDLWHIPVQRHRDWWSLFFILWFAVCMLFSERLALVSPTLLFQEHCPHSWRTSWGIFVGNVQ